MKKNFLSILGILGLTLLSVFSFNSNLTFASTSLNTSKLLVENQLNASMYVEEDVRYGLDETVASKIYFSNSNYKGYITLKSIRYTSSYKIATYGGYVYCSGTCPIY